MVGTIVVQNIQGPTSGANANKVIIPSGQTLDVTEWIAPTGALIQVQQTIVKGSVSPKSTVLSTTSFTFANIVTCSITTKKANSKILIICGTSSYSSVAERGSTRLLRNSTSIEECRYAMYDPGGIFVRNEMNVIDSPLVAANTTITYSYQGRSDNGSGVNYGYGDSGGGPGAYITVMEFAA